MAIKHEQIVTILSDNSYDIFFENISVIYGDRLESITDDTLKSTARMLFFNRKENLNININLNKTNYKIQSNNLSHLVEYMGDNPNYRNLQIWYYPSNLTDLETQWKEVLEGSDRYKINEVMSRWVNGIVIDAPTHTTIFIPAVSIRKEKALEYFHRIVAGLPQYEIFKSFFENGKELTKEELAMLKSLSEDGAGWKAYEANFHKEMNFERLKIEKLVGNFANNPIEKQIANRESEIGNISRIIDDYRKAIRAKIKELEDAQALHMAAIEKAKTAPDINKTIQDFFLNNNNVHLEKKRNNKLYFTAKATLSVYDTDVIERFIKNKASMLYNFSGYGDKISHEVASAFYTKVFIDGQYQIMGIAKWYIDANASCDRAEQTFSSEERKNAMPNPHLYHFSCIGRHKDLFSQAEQDIDFEQAMLVAVQSTASINWNDGMVISRFVTDIWNNNNKVYWDTNKKEFVSRSTIIKEIEKEIASNEEA